MESNFILLSDEQVETIAAFDITHSLDLHDPRFGNAGNTEVVCPTCNMRGDVCMGHHASLSLGISMFHPLMYKESQKIINNVCFGCGNNIDVVAKSKAWRCKMCNYVNHGDYIVYANDMSAAVRHKLSTSNREVKNLGDCKLAGDIPDGVLPDGYVISKILVPPIHLRTPEDMEWSTDIQKLYEHLVQVIRKKGDVCAAYSKITGAQRNEGVTGIMSGKNGIFRNLMMGKRVEFSARAVIVGDPAVCIDQVAVPRNITEKVRVLTTCNRYNITRLKMLADKECLWWDKTNDQVKPHNILPGMTFERAIVDGDLVMFNRQPSLSRPSITCFRVTMRKDEHNVFGLNPQATPPFNADFDGDEMNIFFMSQSCPYTCRAEMSELCHITNCVPVQDVVTGCYIMSSSDKPVSREVWSDCCVINSSSSQKMTTHGLLKMCIPDYRGEVLNRDNIYRTGLNLYSLQLVVSRWLCVHGLTVSLSSVLSTPINKNASESADMYRERCISAIKSRMPGTGIMDMIESKAKGSVTHAVHMAIALGQQYVNGKEGIFCTRSYSRGLTPNEFFGHQMAAREGVVSTNIGTADTGYLNRRACKILADLKLQYNGTVADRVMLSSFNLS